VAYTGQKALGPSIRWNDEVLLTLLDIVKACPALIKQERVVLVLPG
jgi:hypothetical protein